MIHLGLQRRDALELHVEGGLHFKQPDVKVLYVTGFADHLFAARPTLWEDEAFLEKPFSQTGLREAVSLVLFGHTRGVTEAT